MSRSLDSKPASYGDCGIRSLVVNGPGLVRFDLAAVKRIRIHGSVNFEFRAEMLNAFNRPYFNSGSTAGVPLGFSTTLLTTPQGPAIGTPVGGGANNQTGNQQAGTSADSFRLTSLLGDNTSRIMQLIWRVRW